jgi:hypothetical protein
VPGPPERGYPEGLWVRVTAMANGTYTGTLASHPGPGKKQSGDGDPVTSPDQRPPSQAVVERVQALDPGTQHMLLFILCTAVPGIVTAELDALEAAQRTPTR